MSAETTAYSTLSAAGTVTALVVDRIYPDYVPEEHILPAVAIARSDTNYVTTIHSGVPVASQVLLEIWCLAENRREAEGLADAVEPVMGAAGFYPTGRRTEFDKDAEVWATVIDVSYWQ
jgi:hypothetical protein